MSKFSVSLSWLSPGRWSDRSGGRERPTSNAQHRTSNETNEEGGFPLRRWTFDVRCSTFSPSLPGLLCVLVLLWALPSVPAAEPMGMEQCITYAGENSPAVRKLRLDLMNQQLQTKIERAAFAVGLKLDSSYADEADSDHTRMTLSKDFLGGVELSTTLDANRDHLSNDDSASFSVRLSKKILGGGTLLESRNLIDDSLVDETIALNNLSRQQRQLVLDVKRKYYQIIRDKRSLTIQQRRLERSRKNLEHAIEREKPLDIITARIEVPRNELTVVVAERAIQTGLDGLKVSIGMPVEEVLAIIEEFEFQAVETDAANRQHYEVPAEFFEWVLGPRLKYSACLFPTAATTLADAEEEMLRETCRRAEIKDGMSVLELGCGWGSLTLWMAEQYPECQVTAVSSSASQREFIERFASDRGLSNVRVITADMRNFSTKQRFERILSVEMFEHMRNYELLFRRISSWLTDRGKAFVHVFCHRDTPYLFETEGATNWMARHFFTGGTMPSEDLFGHFGEDLKIQRQWRVNGMHYWRTCEQWLKNANRNRAEILARFERDLSPRESKRYLQRWRIFFMACAELFRYGEGDEWFVAHYLLQQTASTSSSQPKLAAAL